MGLLGYEPVEERMSSPDEEGTDGDAASPSARPAEPAVVASVEPDSLAACAGIRPGDRILEINDSPVRDAIDLSFLASDEELSIVLERDAPETDAGVARVERIELEIERAPFEELGVVLRDFRIRTCNNHCVFCFIHQNPSGLRKGIYFKDGDYRMSFLHGNYVTTTNMKEEDFERILEQKLSPMYVSVHATNHDLRLRMLGVKRSNDVLDNLRRLARGRIEFHTQIVLCPGWNDGDELERTIRELEPLRPRLLSIAVVPLGLTEHRDHLPAMKPVSPSFCKDTIARVEPWQKRFKKKYGEPLVYLADEFYITADLPAPSYKGYDVLHQLENGVGMVWQFMTPWRRVERRLPASIGGPRRVAVLTGMLGARVLRPVVERLDAVGGLEVDLVPVTNSLFGKSITVSGLLAGRDFHRAIGENPGRDLYLIPGNAIRHDGGVFLDDMSLEDLRRTTGRTVRAIDGDCADLVAAVLGSDSGSAGAREAALGVAAPGADADF